MNGYAKMHPLDLKVRADMLETIAGYEPERLLRELFLALGEVEMDPCLHNADELRYLAALIAQRVLELEGT